MVLIVPVPDHCLPGCFYYIYIEEGLGVQGGLNY